MEKINFSCVLIGNGSLMIPCGEYLLEKNCKIEAVITSNEEIRKWCSEQKIYSLTEKEMNEISNISFDYLFSIVYLEVLPESIIGLPRKWAINYHDAILPAYAGIHATSWAIINGEKEHGISWHIMEKKLDTGNLLVQKKVEIEPDETTVSLNLKCFQAAIEGFYELVDSLVEGTTVNIAQDLSKRSYYAKWRKPENVGLINWNNKIADILNFVHALEFGEYPNTLATPKIAYKGKIYIVEEIEEYEKAIYSKIGIAKVEKDGIVVGALDGTLKISKLVSLTGKEEDINLIFKDEMGEFSLIVANELKSKLQNTMEQVNKMEPYWIKKYENYHMEKSVWREKIEKVQYQVKSEQENKESPRAVSDEEIIVAIAMELIKCGFNGTQYINYYDTSYHGNTICREGIPLAVDLEQADQMLEYIKTELKNVKKHISFGEDIFYRYKEISQKDIVPFITVYHTDSNLSTYASEVNFIIDTNTNQVTYWCCNEALQAFCLQVIQRLSSKECCDMNRVNEDEIEKFKSVYDLIKEQSIRQKDKIAVISEKEKITYLQLQNRIEERAAIFYHNGIRKGINVGVLLPRNHEVLITFLAIQKLGAVYIPMDATYPEERLNFIASDGEVAYLITDSNMPVQLKAGNFKVIYIDQEKEVYKINSNEVEIKPNDPVYILYTSGSTGVPKGVVVNHLGLVNFLLSMKKEPGFTEDDVLLSVTTVCFDISGLELYLPLISGGVTNILPSQVTNDGIALREIIESSDATVIQATPATWNILLMAGWKKKLPIKILCGGENLPLELADKLLKQCGELWNMYGPTETTIWSTIKRITDKNNINIGKPIDNTQVWIFDKNMKLVKGKQSGELYIGGYGVANGYYKRDELTKERFIDNPLQPGNKIYRTGDLVKKNAEGELIYLGRLDNQVKYHGFRIELEEIEKVIQDKLEIENAVVIIRKDDLNEDALYAFIQTDKKIAQEEIKQNLGKILPHYMIPNEYIVINEFPLTANKKINRKYLASLSIKVIQEKYASTDKKNVEKEDNEKSEGIGENSKLCSVREAIRKVAAQIVKKSPEEIETHKLMSNYGFNSIRYTVFCTKLNKELQLNITPAICYKYKTIDELTNYLVADKIKVEEIKVSPEAKENIKQEVKETISEDDIAIIGIGMCMPQVDDEEQFWDILKQGKCVVGNIPKERWDVDAYKKYDKDYPDFGAFMKDIWSFDSEFFCLSPREIEQMDPQQRIFLQTSWKAIEDAGYNPEKLAGSDTAVYVGTVESDYYNRLSRNIDNADIFTISGNIQCGIANRVSYILDFHGESETINTACSSSLVAIHHAVNALKRKECGMALAGGVNVILNPFMHYALKKNGMLSPDGRCKSFDAEANGYVRGEGCGVILLKRATQAYKDGDYIYAVIKGTGVNHDGCTNSFTAPNPLIQTNLIKKVCNEGHIRPDYLSYIETHGTGTKIGDPIEINALKDAFNSLYQEMHIPKKIQYCALGSVKANIGHLEAAAGIAGVLKVILSMQNKTITKVAGLQEVNPFIEIKDSPFYIPNENQTWEGILDEQGRKRWIAGVSSFGFGGTNAHVILEAFSDNCQTHKKTTSSKYLFPFSNETKEGLKTYIQKVKIYLEGLQRSSWEESCFEQIAYTLQNGRKPCKQRVVFIASNIQELLNSMGTFLKEQQQENIFVGEKDSNPVLEILFDQQDGLEYLKYLANKRRIEKIAHLWVLGLEIDWGILNNSACKKIKLPTYEFKKTRYLIDTIDEYQDGVKKKEVGQLYKKFVVNIEDPYIKEHVIETKSIFPGVKYLELGAQSGLNKNCMPVCLKDNEWINKKVITEEETLYVQLEDNVHDILYKVFSGMDEKKVLHARGKIEKDIQENVNKTINVEEIRSRCNYSISRKQIYEKYTELGYEYGRLYQPLESITYSEQEFLSSIVITEEMQEKISDLRFQISLLEGGMQAVIASFFNNDEKIYFMPTGIHQCKIYSSSNITRAYGYAKLVREVIKEREIIKEFNICIVDEAGLVLIELLGYVLHAQRITVNQSNDITLIQKSYQEELLNVLEHKDQTEAEIMILQNNNREFQRLVQQLKDKYSCNVLDRISDLDTEILRSKIKNTNTILILEDREIELNNYFNLLQVAKECINTQYEGKIVFLYKHRLEQDICYADAVQGFARCYQNETTKSCMIVIKVDDDWDYNRQIENELFYGTRSFVKYEKGSRKVLTFDKVVNQDTTELIQDKEGCYIITGGTGKIGLALSEKLVKRYPCIKLILVSRSGSINDLTEYLRGYEGSNLMVVQADVSDLEQINGVISQVKEKYGRVKGVFHAAGNIADAYIRDKVPEKAKLVLNAKIQGIVNLDFALKQEPLDFMILFSSISAILGNAGQSDYCYANSFLDSFASLRNKLVNEGKRQGYTLSVNWGIWKDGGMQLNEIELQSLRKRAVILPIITEKGLDLLLRLGKKAGCIGAIKVEDDKLLDYLNNNKIETKRNEIVINVENLGESIKDTLKECCHKVIHVPIKDISLNKELSDYGLDSLTTTALADEINEQLGVDITPVTFFEYTTLETLINFLIKEYKDILQERLRTDEAVSSRSEIYSIKENDIVEQNLEFKLSTKIPYTKAHTVFNEPIILGVTYISHFIESIKEYGEDVLLGAFKNIYFHQACAVTEEDYISYEVNVKKKQEEILLTEKCRKAEGDVIVATSTFQKEVDMPQFETNLNEEMLKDARMIEGQSIYDHKWCYDVKYTQELHSVKKVWIMNDITVGYINLKEEVKGLYKVNPAILDGVMICGLYGFLEDVKESYIPYMIKSISIKSTIPDTCYCICKKTKLTDEFLSMDIKIIHPLGQLLCYIKDFVCKRVESSKKFNVTNAKKQTCVSNQEGRDIAIIGISASFANSNSAEEYWKCLIEQQDVIREIPYSHFEYKSFYDPNSHGDDKMYTKWGGFIEDIDKFDASFFRISKREAEVMDPQLRLLLQHTYHAAEDAGYGNTIKGSNTGMYVGNCFHDYQQKMDREQMKVSPHDLTGNALTMLANRPSYCFDLKGPSVNVDTACSSSLVALHMACRALQHGECDMAFVGGVNLLLDSWHYRYFCSIGALSKSGRCHTFTDQADGYIPGDGVAVILLKPLEKAIQDQDSIYGVIKGSAINHGGMTSSVTAPNLAQEIKVIEMAWKDAGIKAEDISYIEAHGTGTKLGDPIEINALKRIFEKSNNKNQTCYIGSAKASIGHTEGAAGLAGVIKVLLSMKYHTIPAMPFFQNMNPYIDLKNSNLCINKEPVYWEPANGKMIAGVSSFGAGGAYAHVVLEEYKQPLLKEAKRQLRIIALSAKTENSLRNICRNMKVAIEKMDTSTRDEENALLRTISYTLLVGREQMDIRLAFLAENIQQVIQRLKDYLQGNTESIYFYQLDEEDEFNVKEMEANLSLEEMAKLWTRGYNISQNIKETLFEGVYQRISLPGYVFEKESFWVNSVKESDNNWVSKEDFFIKNHRIGEKSVMPAVAYLDYLLKAAKEKGLEINTISNLNFMKQLQIDECPKELNIEISIDRSFLIHSKNEEQQETHVQGYIEWTDKVEEVFDKSEEFENLSQELLAENFYKQLNEYGLCIGKEFQSVKKLQYDENRVKAEISISPELTKTFDTFILHPAVLDGVLQSVISRDNDETLHIPFEIREIRLLKRMEKSIVVYGKRHKENNIWDITVVNESGQVILLIKGLLSKGVSLKKTEAIDTEKDWLVKILTRLKNDEISVSEVNRLI